MITSTANAQVKELIRLMKKSRAREEAGVFIVEGPRMAGELTGDPAWKERIDRIYLSESYAGKHKEEAHKLLEYDGFMLGINGVVTFKKSTLPEVLKNVPLKRVVLETDSPYLAPVPYRGKRNESANLVKVAECLSVIYGVPLSEIASRTTENALKVFTNAEKSF